jgi:UDP-glucose 4-epimerase
MNCLILGGAGFIGSHLVDALVEKGHYVRVFDRPNIDISNLKKSINHIDVCPGDFNNVKNVSEALSGIDVVVNLVCTTLPAPSNENPLYDVESNVKGNIIFLEKAIENRIKKVVFASSGGTVYGIPEQMPVAENHRTDPLCSYGISKLTVEKYLYLFNHLYNLDYTVLRLANPYGERQKTTATQGVVAVFLGKVLHDLPVHIWGDGSVARDFIYIKDMVQAFVRAIEKRTSSKIFNIGSGNACSIKKLLDVISYVTGKDLKIEFKPARNMDVPAIALDIKRAAHELDWRPKETLESGIKRTWQWLMENHRCR